MRILHFSCAPRSTTIHGSKADGAAAARSLSEQDKWEAYRQPSGESTMSTQRSIRTAFAFLCAIVFAGFALPASAIDKFYSVEYLLEPQTRAADGDPDPDAQHANPLYDSNGHLVPPTETTVLIKNLSPPSTGSSNAGAARFDVIGVAIDSVWCPSGSCTFAGNTVTAEHIGPIRGGQVFPIVVRVASCVTVGEARIENIVVTTGTYPYNGDPFFPSDSDPTFPLVTTLSYPVTFDPAGISCGDITCGETLQVPTTAAGCTVTSTSVSCVTIVRGYNTNSATCPGNVDYFVLNNVDNDFPGLGKKLDVQWATDPHAAFMYKVNIPADAVAAGALNNFQTAWLTYQGQEVFIPAAKCMFQALSPPTDLPLPFRYGVTKTAMSSTTDKLQLKLDPGQSVPPNGSAVMVGNERMIVVSSAGSGNLTVTRAAGTPAEPHPADAEVMFTTNPQLFTDYLGNPYSFPTGSPQASAGYTVGMKAPMCLATDFIPNGDGSYSVWVGDSSDGWINW
jgi:hypothetical protein